MPPFNRIKIYLKVLVDLFLFMWNDEVPCCLIDVNRKPWSQYKCSLVSMSVTNSTLTKKM